MPYADPILKRRWQRIRAKAIYHERKTACLCVLCGIAPPVANKVHCAYCRQYLKEAQIKHYESQS